MAIPDGATHVVLSGTAPQGEIFATGFWLMGGAIDSEADANIAAQAIADLAKWDDTGAGHPATFVGSDTSFDTVNVYQYVTGNPRAAFIGEASLGPRPGQANQGPLPLQCCYVVSLRSGLPGRSRRGRMYLPCTNQSLTNHQLDETDVEAIAAWWKGYFDELNALGDTVGVLNVVSRTLSSAVEVSSLIVDSRLDIQRRRANGESVLFTETTALA